MLSVLYNALWYPALPFALFASGGLSAENRRQRLGLVDWAATDAAGANQERLRMWVHAASVGEVEAVRAVALGLLNASPAGAEAAITVMTEAGREAARRRIPGARFYMLAPLDCPRIVRGFLSALRPQLVLIAETELWPNYFVEAHRLGARVAIVNGRISGRSFKRYRWARSLFANALTHVDLVLAQTDDDARRYIALGALRERVVVTGNTKFALDGGNAAKLRRGLESFAAGRPILIAGSTAPGEERIVLEAYLKLRSRFSTLALVLAPRHFSRTGEVEGVLRQASLPYTRASALDSAAAPEETPNVLLLDTMGELRALYRRAAISFIGGSIASGRGGQNLAEPAEVSVPVLFGPFHENQRETALALIQSGGGRVVRNADEMERVCAELLANENARREAGLNARSAVERMAGGAAAALLHLKALANLG
jgi:3-deoxy-D-manno-octulosonic-acid transferase